MSTRHLIIFALSLLAAISAASAVGKRGGTIVGGYSPIKDTSDPYVLEIAKFAVTEYNKEKNKHLAVVKVVKGESQVVAGTNYRLVISANDNHQYQVVVYDKPWQHYRSLTSFTAL